MKKSRLLGAVCAAVFIVIALPSHAALVSRLAGQAIYDTDLDITWLANTNFAADELSDTRVAEIISATGSIDGHTLADADFEKDVAGVYSGRMTWLGATAWVDQLDFGGIIDWRLPDTLQPDTSCDLQGAPGSRGFNCTGSELGHLFYNELGGTAGQSITIRKKAV
jgi:hypothetical protein